MEIETCVNTSNEVLFSNVFENSRRPCKWVKEIPEHDGHAVLVGGGPSVADWLDEIRYRESIGQTIFALNGAAKYLHEHGIGSDYTVIVDARESNVDFIGYADKYLLASQCSPAVFQLADTTLWHQYYPDDIEAFDAALPKHDDDYALIGGGTTVGLSALGLAYTLGYRKLHLYGYDSSYRDTLHAYPQTDPQGVDCDVTVAGRTFRTTLAMAQQAEQFPIMSDQLIDLGCTITIRGDGLLPWTSQNSAAVPMAEAEKYQRMWDLPAYRNFAPGEQTASLFLAVARPEKESYIIDFGAGTGRGALKIHKAGYPVGMVDFADNCLDAEVKQSISDKLLFVRHDLTEKLGTHALYGYCTDVMEHIPTEDVDLVLSNIFNAAANVFFQISTVPDHMGSLIGQALHLTVRPFDWWYTKLQKYGDIIWSDDQGSVVLFYVKHPLHGEVNAGI